jgi:two-component system chemotaxis sensor kinase CheA
MSGGAVRVDAVGEAEIATVRGRRVPLIGLAELLGVDARLARDEQKLILLKPAGGDVYALIVDSVHDHEELVVKPAAPAVMAAGLYAGTTLADDGRPILLLDPSGMAKCAGIRFQEEGNGLDLRAEADKAEAARRETNLLLFRGLDGRRRAVPVAVVERIEDISAEAIGFSAGRLRAAVGDHILPLAGCDAAPESGKLRILRLTDGASEIAYGFAEVVDIRSLLVDLQPGPTPAEVAGVFLVDGVQVELLDPHWLFAAHGDATSSDAEPPVCALPEGDQWIDNMLRPLIESLGYRIAKVGDPADLVIALEDEDAPPDANVVRIRASAQGKNGIYRYDHAALIGALTFAKGGAHG